MKINPNFYRLLCNNGIRNGVGDLRIVESRELENMESNLKCKKAILSPSTGILDSHSFMFSLMGDLEKHGGFVSCRITVSQVRKLKEGFAALYGIESPGLTASLAMVDCVTDKLKNKYSPIAKLKNEEKRIIFTVCWKIITAPWFATKACGDKFFVLM